MNHVIHLPDEKHRQGARITAVACAIIEQDGKILAAQRSDSMSMAGLWEFPGGKIRPGESVADCLIRELEEELSLAITPRNLLPAVVHHYPDFTIRLIPMTAVIATGTPILHEHQAIRWLMPAALPGLNWSTADKKVVAAYLGLYPPTAPRYDMGILI